MSRGHYGITGDWRARLGSVYRKGDPEAPMGGAKCP